MANFTPDKLHTTFSGFQDSVKGMPRKYTLTHSDISGELFLTIGSDYDYPKFNGIYSKIMRDEVLGEWLESPIIALVLDCHVSGGWAFGPAKWRESIFKQHMAMVLEAICYGDRDFFSQNEKQKYADILVNFNYHQPELTHQEDWGKISNYLV